MKEVKSWSYKHKHYHDGWIKDLVQVVSGRSKKKHPKFGYFFTYEYRQWINIGMPGPLNPSWWNGADLIGVVKLHVTCRNSRLG